MTAVRLTVLPEEPIGRIAPELHGQFAEHLGELVYPGIWVGPDSSVPNVDGIRTDVVEALKALRIPILRWPGGCFADDYHWRDGIGPREERPKRLNIHWGMAEEPNAFGTHEFLQFARAIGAEPYLATNLGSGTPQEMRDWIEYCNPPSGTALSDERRRNGAEDPYGIRWWGIGNENWGCGGNLTPEFYAEEYCRYRTFAFPFGGTVNAPVACGPNGWDWGWTQRFFDQVASGTRGNRLDKVEYFAAHYYCRTAGTATDYTDAQWLELLTKAIGIEGVITGHRAIMDGYDPDRRIGLILDEWGTWHPPQPDKPARGLYQQNTMRDACVAALSLDIFHNHADKLVMANIAQLINVLQAMLLVDETRCVATPTFHTFALYAEHQGATALRTVSDAPVISNGEDGRDQASLCYQDKRTVELRQVSGSASVRDDRLCVTLVNADPVNEAEVELVLRGGGIRDAELITLAGDDIHAHNTFEDPERVTPASAKPIESDSILRLTLPAASVSRVTGSV